MAIKYVAYYRVSTDTQAHSGLGLEAQQATVSAYLSANAGHLLRAFTEVESGKRDSNRPQLLEALDLCRRHRARLLIAKLDRMSRNVAFISSLMESDVKFVACDMPTADPFRLHIEAAVAEEERRKISERTRAALAAAKARGVKLGGWRGHPISSNATAALRRNAAKRAADVMPAIRKAQATGITTYKGIAKALNDEGVPTARESTWRAAQVRRVIARAATEEG